MNALFVARQRNRPRCASVGRGGGHQCGADSAPGSSLCPFHVKHKRKQVEARKAWAAEYRERNHERIKKGNRVRNKRYRQRQRQK